MSDASREGRIIRTVTELLVAEDDVARWLSTTVTEREADGGTYGQPEPVEQQYPLTGITGKKRTWAIVTEVVDGHDYLSLDDEGDRQVLIEALVEALS